MTICISAVSGKGGAGKTTAVILLAGEYALEGKSVLLIDADGRQNLNEWWKRSTEKGNQPDGITLVTAATGGGIQRILETDGEKYDVVIMDSPGQDTVTRDTIIAGSHVVITPIQPNQDEILASGQAAQDVADTSDRVGRRIPHLIYKTRISMPSRALAAYRLIRPFVENLKEGGYDSHLLETELVERNPYREIRSGFGTLQMLELTDSIKKARMEVVELKQEIEAFVQEQVEG
ncbi:MULTISPECIES: ParA family protein [Agrobacterium]|uniref:ParA family protein n=1 Tax=Agrobacterium TaxID=357 RepID=UPI0009BBC4F1|nr:MULTISPECIES: ParA family protein [Agrobacterium]QCL77381.1 ParA family protein [Agrobacterium tumefaciens]CUX72315.1 Chromosome partitioning protein [Agrobacterium sp. NCPPB 925]